jgi:hypothetical protein
MSYFPAALRAPLSRTDQQAFTITAGTFQQVIREGIASLPVLLLGGTYRRFCGTKLEGISRFLGLQGLPVTNFSREMAPRRSVAGLESRKFCFVLPTRGSHAILDESGNELGGNFQRMDKFFR